MHKFFVAPLLFSALVLSPSSFACSFKTSDAENIREVVRQHGGYPISDVQCNFLNQKGLALDVSGHSTVLDGASVAWAIIKLSKPGTGINSDAFRLSTYVNAKVASQDQADSMLFNAIEDSIKTLDFVKAADEVQRYAAKKK